MKRNLTPDEVASLWVAAFAVFVERKDPRGIVAELRIAPDPRWPYRGVDIQRRADLEVMLP